MYNHHITPHLQLRPFNNKTQTYLSIEPWTWEDGKQKLLVFTSTGIDLDMMQEPLKLDKNGNMIININYYGKNNKERENILNRLYDADVENHKILTSLGFKLTGPFPLVEDLEKGAFTFYHYQCTAPKGGKEGLTIVDDNFKVHANNDKNPINNFYNCDLGTLAKPFYGSTSLVAGSLGYDCAKSINKELDNENNEKENNIDKEMERLISEIGKLIGRNILKLIK